MSGSPCVPRGFSTGGQCFVLWKDREYASHRRALNVEALQIDGVPKTRTMPARRNRNRPQTEQSVTDPVDPDLFVPKDEAARAPYLASFNQFCSVFPDAFYISERGRMFVDDPGDKGRLLTAGLHNSLGYFRDDTPLMELILDENGRRDLDRLWLDFDTIARVPERMHIEFFHYERAESQGIQGPEFNFARAEDSDNTSTGFPEKTWNSAEEKSTGHRRGGGAAQVAIHPIAADTYLDGDNKSTPERPAERYPGLQHPANSAAHQSHADQDPDPRMPEQLPYS